MNAAAGSSQSSPSERPDFKVADLALAEWGRKEIRIAETEMPGVSSARLSPCAVPASAAACT